MADVFRAILRLLSQLTHPMVVALPAFGLLALAGGGEAPPHRAGIALAAILFSSLVPMGYILALKRRGLIRSVDVEEKGKRLQVFAVALSSFALGFLVLDLLRAGPLVRGLMFCYGTNAVALLLISRHWKVSVHPAGVIGPVVALHLAFGAAALPLYALVAAVGAARVLLEKHTPAQVLTGTALGAASTVAQLQLLFV